MVYCSVNQALMELLTIVNFVLSLTLGASIMAYRANSKVCNNEGS